MKLKRSFSKGISILIIIMLMAVFTIGTRNFLSTPMERVPDSFGKTSAYRAYYLLNIDGMKGLGHSALLLRDSSGEAQVFSYNGMQYNLAECLLGKAGIGKMKQFSLSPEEAAQFLKTGDLQVEEYAECDNFDRTIYRDITKEQYEILREGIQQYIEIGDEFERLYADDAAQLESFLQQENLPRYQIYTHNCDTVARELLALINDEIASYNETSGFHTPGGHYKQLCKTLGEQWGIQKLGEDTITERLLADY